MEKLIPEKLKEARLNAGMTIEQLYFESGINHATLGAWERGTTSPTVSKLCKVADVLKIKMADLFGEVTDTTCPN